MVTVLIGHRGVGKSSLLERLKAYYPEEKKANTEFYDLDQIIEKQSERSIQDIFSRDGEAFFRKTEREGFQSLISDSNIKGKDLVIALGAGFDLSALSSDHHVIWVRRKTDLLGRVFLDRPALEPGLSAIDEYKTRAQKRNSIYEEVFDEELTLPEGLDQGEDEFERAFFNNEIQNAGGVLTILPENMRGDWDLFIQKRLKWGFDYFEVRDDLLEHNQIRRALETIPPEKVLYSFRKKDAMLPDPDKLSRVALWDWPLELGNCPFGSPSVVSLHERHTNESIEAAISRLESQAPSGAYLKLAIYTHNFTELETGYRWMLSRAPDACFLPRSLGGRWSWFRLMMKGHFPLNFVREGMGSAIDQPHLLEWLRQPQKANRFAAVLGYPVIHSHTPQEHYSFFKERNMPVLAIPLGDPEWESGIEFLKEMGLSFGAITSPLKKKAFAFTQIKTEEAKKFLAVNTITRMSNGDWHGHSTDFEGLKALLSDIDSKKKIAVWGGGGVLSQIKELIPQAQFYSVRSGKVREGSEDVSPDIVLWAAPRAKEYALPPANWKPVQVIDLNYREDSSGKEYALSQGSEYISGLRMFKVQAAAQRELWSRLEAK